MEEVFMEGRNTVKSAKMYKLLSQRHTMGWIGVFVRPILAPGPYG